MSIDAHSLVRPSLLEPALRSRLDADSAEGKHARDGHDRKPHAEAQPQARTDRVRTWQSEPFTGVLHFRFASVERWTMGSCEGRSLEYRRDGLSQPVHDTRSHRLSAGRVSGSIFFAEEGGALRRPTQGGGVGLRGSSASTYLRKRGSPRSAAR